MAIAGDDPMLLAEMDPEKVSRANKANAVAYKPARERITEFKINWNIISWPGKAWAKRVFPNVNEQDAIKKLGDAIFHAHREYYLMTQSQNGIIIIKIYVKKQIG